jgi:NADH dehydrogenase/NADH:ubiquinone oxidoreductase subunit G
MTALAEKADVVLPMTALYERSGSIIDTYGKQKTFAAAQDAAGVAKDGVDIAAELSLVISKTKGFKQKDVAAAVKKFKAGKLAAPSFKPVSAKASQAAARSASALLAALNQGLLANSAVAKVLVPQGATVQK